MCFQTPVFLDVGQIIAGYSFQRNLDATVGTNLNNGKPVPTAVICSFASILKLQM